MSLCFTYKIFYVNLNKNYCSAQCDAAEQLISHLACKWKLAVHSSPLNVWSLIQQAKVYDKACSCFDKETLLIWVIIQSLWLLCCATAVRTAQCDCVTLVTTDTVTNVTNL